VLDDLARPIIDRVLFRERISCFDTVVSCCFVESSSSSLFFYISSIVFAAA